MAQFKISEYPAKTVFNDGDLYDISTYDGVSAYTSEKLTFAQLKTELNSALSFLSSGDNVSSLTNDAGYVTGNLYTADGTLTGNRTVTMGGNYVDFNGGNFGIGIGTAPSEKLHVSGNARVDGNAIVNIAATTFSGINFQANGRVYFSNNITGNGRDGVEIDSLANRTVVKAYDNGITTFELGYANAVGGGLVNTIIDDVFLISKKSGGSVGKNLHISASDSRNDMFIDELTGNIAINNGVTASERLHVNGKIRLDNSTAGTAGASSGTYLVINVGGTDYKIDLLAV